MRAFDRDVYLAISVYAIVIVTAMLAWENTPNAFAATFFGVIGFGFGALVLFFGIIDNPPVKLLGNFKIREALPYLLFAELVIYSISRFFGLLFPSLFQIKLNQIGSFIPTPNFGSYGNALLGNGLPLLSLSNSTTNPLQGLVEVVLWNLVVAWGEEAFKLAIIVGLSLYFIHSVRSGKQIKPKNLVIILGVGLIVVWSLLHSLQNYGDLGSLSIAALAGGVLFWLFLKFENILAPVLAHLGWNVFASTAPGFCIVRSSLCQPPSLATFGVNLPGVQTVDPYLVLFGGLALMAWYLLKHGNEPATKWP